MKKTCSKCGKEKLLREFNKNRNTKDGHHHYCRDCNSEQKKASYISNEAHRNNLKLKSIEYRLGITPEQVTELHSKHDGKCAICNKEFESLRKTFIDHDHVTGSVRGLLCPKCNNLLGACNDDIKILESAISYLKNVSVPNHKDTHEVHY